MKRIEKTVKVSDPYRWYGRKEIDVVMWHPECWDNTDEMKNCVCIMFMSIDDTAVGRNFNKWNLEANWNWCKEWLFDKIPTTVSTEWMYKHGYVPL